MAKRVKKTEEKGTKVAKKANNKFPDPQVLRKKHDEGISDEDMAKEYGYTEREISMIRRIGRIN